MSSPPSASSRSGSPDPGCREGRRPARGGGLRRSGERWLTLSKPPGPASGSRQRWLSLSKPPGPASGSRQRWLSLSKPPGPASGSRQRWLSLSKPPGPASVGERWLSLSKPPVPASGSRQRWLSLSKPPGPASKAASEVAEPVEATGPCVGLAAEVAEPVEAAGPAVGPGPFDKLRDLSCAGSRGSRSLRQAQGPVLRGLARVPVPSTGSGTCAARAHAGPGPFDKLRDLCCAASHGSRSLRQAQGPALRGLTRVPVPSTSSGTCAARVSVPSTSSGTCAPRGVRAGRARSAAAARSPRRRRTPRSS